MTQEEFNIKLVKQYINSNPEPKNKDLYQYCNAITPSQESNVRREKLKILKKIKTQAKTKEFKEARQGGGTIVIFEKKLTEEYIEALIRQGLDDNPNNVQLIGKATDFFIKVKTDKKEGTKQLLDMEGFLKLAEDKSK